MEKITDVLLSIAPAEWCQGFFVMAAAAVLVVAVTPETARRQLVDYGPRSATKQPQDERAAHTDRDQGEDLFTKLVITITSWGQVPHSWFSGFYVTSVAGSVFWLIQYYVGGQSLSFIASMQAEKSTAAEDIGQVALVWGLMALQGARRLSEQVFLVKPSKSTIWIVHWLLGIFFYAFVSVSIWVEGSSKDVLEIRLPHVVHHLVDKKSLFRSDTRGAAISRQYQYHHDLGPDLGWRVGLLLWLDRAISVSQSLVWTEEVLGSQGRHVSIPRVPALHL